MKERICTGAGPWLGEPPHLVGGLLGQVEERDRTGLCSQGQCVSRLSRKQDGERPALTAGTHHTYQCCWVGLLVHTAYRC